MSDAEAEDMDRDEAASSSGDGGSESGSSDADGQSDDAEESSSEEEIEPRVLPNRTTRGSKIGKLVEEDEADQDFWQQGFFQEEERDDEWETSESESEDEPDTDFDESEDEGDDEEKNGEPEEHRQKRLAPPGAKKKSRAAARAAGAGASPRTRSVPAAIPLEAEAPTLRASTRARVEVAEAERARQEAAQAQLMAKRRTKSQNAPEVKPLTQEELLAEAAKTELENQRSLQLLLAREEEVKRRSAVTATKYAGPVVRYHSQRVGKDTEQTRLELVNMREAPAPMQPQRAPPHPEQPVCRVSGLPAKYRHPQTGMPYATLEAYAQIERHTNGGAHAASPATAQYQYGGIAGSGHVMPSAVPNANQWHDQGLYAAAEWQHQQSGGLQAAHMYMGGDQSGPDMSNLAAY